MAKSLLASVLSPDSLHQQFFKHSDTRAYLVAYSGGLDSHVLLHLLASIAKNNPSIQVRSIYIDHGLQQQSSVWADHCQKVADGLHVQHQSIALNLKIPKGESLEAVARKARYQALESQLCEDEILLTAHHQDDQAETLLLQLLRGSGIDGLAAMPLKNLFSKGYHLRPLLGFSRNQLENYADVHALHYITDPSNQDDCFDRNYLRNTIIPKLKQRWPQMGKTLSRSAALHAEASELQALYLQDEMPLLTGSREGTLSAQAINKLPLLKQKAALRHWIKQSAFRPPSARQLQHIIDDVLNSAVDATPLVAWSSDSGNATEIRRYQDDVYIMSSLEPLPNSEISWDITTPLIIENSQLVLNPDSLGELKKILLERQIPVIVCFRQGGESIQLRNRGCSIALKKLFQEEKIPPWLRNRTPLIFANYQLISVYELALIHKQDLKII